jgi:hypothetical protein
MALWSTTWRTLDAPKHFHSLDDHSIIAAIRLLNVSMHYAYVLNLEINIAFC